MKKQILILVFLVLAVFAGVNKSYGQCTAGPLAPAAGVEYDYEVAVSGGTATVAIYNWFVTQNVNVLTGFGAPITPGTDFAVVTATGFSLYNTAVATNTTSKIRLNWTSAAIANGAAYYVAVKYTETGSAGCTVENMKVWQVKPINTFFLAIKGSDLSGDISKNNTCPPDIDGAVITPSATAPKIAYTYGQTIISYKVIASGVNGTWTPSLQLPAPVGATTTLQNYNTAEWSVDGSTNWHAFSLTDGDIAGGNYTSATTTAPVTVAGSTIYIRVKIDNVNFESLASQAILAGIDGTLPGGVKDIVGGGTCTDEVDYGKTGTYTINARPTVGPTTTGAFITKAP